MYSTLTQLTRSIRHSSLSGTVLSKELLQSLESSTNFLLGNLGQCEDFSEGTGNTTLAAGDEDAAGDDSLLSLTFESLGIINELEEMLGCVGNVLGNVDGVAMSTNLLVCGEKSLGGLVSGRFALSTKEVAAASAAVTEGDGGLKLRTIEKRICAITNTRRIIVALIII
jgi:hypothetical protein